MSDDPTPQNSKDILPYRQHPSTETLERGAMEDQTLQSIHAQLMREKEEPSEGFAPTPIFLIFVFGAMMFWAGIYLITHSGGFRGNVFDPNWKPTAETSITQIAFDPIKQGAKLFTRQCQQCHQADAKGIAGVYPPLAESEWVNGKEERVIMILLNGLTGLITVEGNNYNGNMPDVNMWKDRDIAAVLTYVRSHFGNNAPAISEDQVKEVRAQYGSRHENWTAPELLAIHPF